MMEQWGPCRDWQICEGDRQLWDGDGAVRATRGVAGSEGRQAEARCGAGGAVLGGAMLGV